MKPAKAGKPTGQQSGSASPKPVKSWSKVAASGAAKPAVQEPQQQNDKDKDTNAKASHEKLLVILASLVNTEAEVSTKSGAKYRGLVKSVDVAGDVAVVLRNAKQVIASSGSVNGTETLLPEIAIKPNDLLEVHAAKVELGRPGAPTSGVAATTQKSQTNAWKTDTDISGRGQAKERVLQPWQPPADDEGFSIEDDLTTPSKSSTTANKKWDQFAANEKLFGVKSQWDEDVYTHKLDTSRPDFARRQAEAEKLAREIEQSSSTNAHVMEERGVADDSGLTEEDKYSGVQRNPHAWVPPARRPVVNLPTPRPSAVDPAIISSQLAKPGSSGQKPTQIEVHTPRAGEGNKAQDGLNESASRPSNPLETDIMARFKQFATNERDRLSVKKAATFKKEKDGRLQDLLAFSKDFKLHTPVPEDLIPILAKDKAKQEAIVQKAASGSSSAHSTAKNESPVVKAVEAKVADTLRARVDKAHRSPVAQATPTPLTKEQTSELKKLKPSAAEFKPFNPAASSFTPSFGQKIPQISSPVLSTASSQPRQPQFSAEATAFFPKKPKPLSERSPILDQFDPFKTYAAKHPDSNLDIEIPLKVDPAWPSSQDAPSITDPPPGSLRPPQLEEHFQAAPQQFAPVSSPQLMYVGSPQQSHSFHQQQQSQGYYPNKNQQFVPGPPGQFIQYQTSPGFVPPQYMYPGMQGYNPRMMQPQMMQVPFPPQQYNNYNQPMMGHQQMIPSGYNGSPRGRQTTPSVQRNLELQKPTPRPPPMSAEAPKET